MIFYDYDCSKCGIFELRQSIHDDALTSCPQCGSPIHRIIHSPEVMWLGRFRFMKGNPEVDMDKIEAEQKRDQMKIIDGKIKEGLKERSVRCPFQHQKVKRTWDPASEL